MDNSLYASRRRRNVLATASAYLATAVGLAWLALILGELFWKGFSGLSLRVFTEMTPPPGASGGLLNAIVGSIIMTLLALVIGTPIGILAGTYMAEYGRHDRLTSLVRFINDILLSAPSIVVGLFIYELMVRPMGHFSGIAGAVVLGVLVVPVMVRTTEDMLMLVPDTLREAAASIGLPRSLMIRQVAYRAARAGNHHRHPVGCRPGEWRDGAVAVYGAEQPVLQHRSQCTHVELARGHLPVRAQPLQGLAGSSLDRGTHHHAGRPCAQHFCPDARRHEEINMNVAPSTTAPGAQHVADESQLRDKIADPQS